MKGHSAIICAVNISEHMPINVPIFFFKSFSFCNMRAYLLYSFHCAPHRSADVSTTVSDLI